MTALKTCYGNLSQPNFRNVYPVMEGPTHRRLVEELRAKGIKVTETTDLNNDVATHLVAYQDGDKVGLALSGVGPFAILRHKDSNGRYCWVTQSDRAPTALATLIGEAVERAGFKLLSRDTVIRTVAMNRADGAIEATLYQALFTDSDQIP